MFVYIVCMCKAKLDCHLVSEGNGSIWGLRRKIWYAGYYFCVILIISTCAQCRMCVHVAIHSQKLQCTYKTNKLFFSKCSNSDHEVCEQSWYSGLIEDMWVKPILRSDQDSLKMCERTDSQIMASEADSQSQAAASCNICHEEHKECML